MHSSDLGPAMALAGAEDAATRKALKRVAEIAEHTAAEIDFMADTLADPHDHAAVKNQAIGWRLFAQNLRGVI